MSLPLPRRIAQAALLLGAAAAPLVGAGAAHAAAPQQGLGGLSRLDLGGNVKGASHEATTLAGTTGTQSLRTALPATDHVVGTLSSGHLPAARTTAGQAADAAGQVLGGAAESASGSLPGVETLPNAGALPATAALPTTGILTDRLPLRGLPLK